MEEVGLTDASIVSTRMNSLIIYSYVAQRPEGCGSLQDCEGIFERVKQKKNSLSHPFGYLLGNIIGGTEDFTATFVLLLAN